MDRETIDVLAVLGLTTAAMLYYARFYLPAKIEARTRESMKAFSTSIELRFPVREGLSNRVVALSREAAIRMGLSHKQVVKLEMAARLRDIGLCAVPYQLVNDKPVGEWSQGDKDIYERHPEVGAAMLELAPSLKHLSGIVRTHQARFDGGGGPFFPSREDLQIEARILKVISDYVWMERTQGALLAKTALREGAGTVYDPDVVFKVLALLSSSRGSESPTPTSVV